MEAMYQAGRIAKARGTSLYECSKKVKELIEIGRFEECRKLIIPLFSLYPDNGEPQSLYGLLLEAQGDHVEAMKHFRAACALDPGYVPATKNMEHFGSFDPRGAMAYNEDDCPGEKDNGSFGSRRQFNTSAVLTI